MGSGLQPRVNWHRVYLAAIGLPVRSRRFEEFAIRRVWASYEAARAAARATDLTRRETTLPKPLSVLGKEQQ